MLECEHIGILFLNLKKLANPVDDLKKILVLQKEMFLLMIFCKRVLKQREDIPRYVKTTNSFLGKVCSTIFCTNCLFKNILMHLSTKVLTYFFIKLRKIQNY